MKQEIFLCVRRVCVCVCVRACLYVCTCAWSPYVLECESKTDFSLCMSKQGKKTFWLTWARWNERFKSKSYALQTSKTKSHTRWNAEKAKTFARCSCYEPNGKFEVERYTMYDGLKMFAWANIINNFLKRTVSILLHVSMYVCCSIVFPASVRNNTSILFSFYVVLFFFFIFCFYSVVAAAGAVVADFFFFPFKINFSLSLFLWAFHCALSL